MLIFGMLINVRNKLEIAKHTRVEIYIFVNFKLHDLICNLKNLNYITP